MAQSRPLCIGLEVHKETMAGAYVAQAHGAEGPSMGPRGTRQGESDPLSRPRPSQAPPLLCVSAAGPWGDWRDRCLPPPDSPGWGVAPALLPKKAGERVTTDRRDAVHLARLARAGALPAV